MVSRPDTLRDMKVYQDIHTVLSDYFPERFVSIICDHMRGNEEDSYDHEYLRDSLFVMQRLIGNSGGLELADIKLLYGIVALMESGRPYTRDKPYELSPGISWVFLRLYAPEVFDREDLAFISKSCKPLMPQTLRPSHRVQLQLLVHNTKQLTNVVNFKYQKLYDNFTGGKTRRNPDDNMHELFLEYYGPNGNVWPAISESAKLVFNAEISKFKREVQAAVKRIR